MRMDLNHIGRDRDGSFCVNLTRGLWFKLLILLIYVCRKTNINSDEK